MKDELKAEGHCNQCVKPEQDLEDLVFREMEERKTAQP